MFFRRELNHFVLRRVQPFEHFLVFCRSQLALQHLGTVDLDLETASATLGALVKYREDTDRVKQAQAASRLTLAPEPVAA